MNRFEQEFPKALVSIGAGGLAVSVDNTLMGLIERNFGLFNMGISSGLMMIGIMATPCLARGLHWFLDREAKTKRNHLTPKLTETSASQKVLRVEVKLTPQVETYEREIACGCGHSLVYGPFKHTTYTRERERVDISRIWGYKCDSCGLVSFLPEVAKELTRRIDEARQTEQSYTAL